MNNQWKVMEPFPMLNATLLQHDDITPLPLRCHHYSNQS